MADQEAPTPIVELMTSFGRGVDADGGKADLIAARSVCMVDSRRSSGESEASGAKGFSEVRRGLRVDSTAWAGRGVVRAFWRSVWDVGVPWMMVRFGWGVSEDGLRTRAVTVWPRSRADWMVSLPLRPLPPEM